MGDSIVDSPCGRQCCTSMDGVHRVTPNFTIRRGLDLGDENEKKGLIAGEVFDGHQGRRSARARGGVFACSTVTGSANTP